MSDLLTQLREYGTQLDSLTTPLEDLTPTGHPPAHVKVGWRGPLVAVGTAAAIVVIAVAAAFLLGGPESADPASPGVEATLPVFDMRADSFCEWFTAPEMNEIVAAAQQRARTDYEFEKFTPGTSTDSNCSAHLDVGPAGHRWDTENWLVRSSIPEDVSVSIYFASWFEDDPDFNPDAFEGNRLLDDEVSYQIRLYTHAWQEGVGIYLQVDRQGDQMYYFGFGVDDHNDVTRQTPEYEELGLAIVNELLQRMNWIDTNN